MSKDLSLNSDLDVIFENGDVQQLTDDDEIYQRVCTTLRTRLSEFDPDTEVGLDDENIYGKNVKKDYLETDIEDAIATQVSDIVQVNKVEIGDPDENRNIQIQLDLQTVNGTNIQPTVNVQAQGGEG
ncbi:hypothetical protein FD12_GL001383 [Lentilactobacillus rapi DSM 19907 = JCM 15042]|uniref:DUF2634 domain-containing protein n=3 Tax=Lactobacillaceae TaxID=33958 RepID=A0A0R2FI72_9LACO|nr:MULTISPECIES: hypothetical protein [Lactobacillaceae]KRL17854.1 hypothetical protein FD12_GL001383 [Lentilactobacillus rapi DSM 19907 = JCM 15042]KRN27339.1 hypothetical protein IV38_GL002162 [Lactobacillus selangorensis]GEP72041.1 hypothetical protein LRA02_09090 [Lentilactobacillus rapi]